MRIIAALHVRDEAWCLGMTLRAALRWVDAAVVLLHACSDETPGVLDEISREHPGRVVRLVDANPLWREAEFRERTLRAARGMGATHVAIIDADEMLAGPTLADIRGIAEMLGPRQCLWLPWRHCWRSMDQYRVDDSPFGRAYAPVVFQDDWVITHGPGREYQTHSRPPVGAVRVDRDCAGLMHLQHAEWRRLAAKQALYVVNETMRYGAPKANYAGTVDEMGLRLADVPAEWWTPYADLRRHLHLGREPWQEAECRRLVAQHGRDKFGDLFGVC